MKDTEIIFWIFFSLKSLKNLPHNSPKFDAFSLQFPKTEGKTIQFKGEG